ncbi:MAG: nucleoside triphosphate pyrophosphohydrolase [Steroidobacteraceae bacterium]
MSGGEEALAGLRRLLAVMQRLRDPVSGCAWDRAQDARSLARYTLEEAYELVDAIEAGDERALRDELGDLLFQVVFHAQLLAERGCGDFDQVARGIADKLQRRHPHVFGDATPSQADWESLKAQERAARGDEGAFAGIPAAMPALGRAAKIGRRAAQAGFDWPDAAGAMAKVLEEIDEVHAASVRADARELEEEVGDLLLAVTSLARHLKVDPETALRAANRKFEARYTCMEQQAARQGQRLQDLTPAEQDALWRRAKRDIQS